MKLWWIGMAAKIAALVVLAAAVFGYVVMALWNALIPDLFHGPVITYWQAIGLIILSHILFRGGSHAGHSHRRWHANRWKSHFEKRYAAMTPEEKEKFRERWERRCGPWTWDDAQETK